MAAIITPNLITSTTPVNGTNFQLEELKEIVGGWIEIVRCPDDWIMVVNEEGQLLNLPYNPIASLIAGQPIVGDVLWCPSNQVK